MAIRGALKGITVEPRHVSLITGYMSQGHLCLEHKLNTAHRMHGFVYEAFCKLYKRDSHPRYLSKTHINHINQSSALIKLHLPKKIQPLPFPPLLLPF